jgi:F-type H+-transporting ATPase subunit b
MRIRALVTTAALVLGGTVAMVATAAPVLAQATTETTKPIPHVSEECIKKLEEGGVPEDCQKAPSPILPATNELVWGGIAFFLMLGVMWKFAYPPIKSALEARTQRIRDNLDEAERTKNDAQRILDDYQRQLADAKNESSRIIEEARQTAEQMRKDLIARAEAEAAELRQRNQAEIRAATERLMVDIQVQVRNLAIELAEKVVEKNLDRDTQLALIESYINQVGSSR